MSNNYSTLNLLNIEDENIFISNEPIQLVSFGSQSAKLVHAYLNHSFDSCPCCHTVSPKLHKHGSKTSKIVLNRSSNFPIILALNKQRYLCTHCHRTFFCSSPIVDKHCFISNQVKLSIIQSLTFKRSEKDIALDHFVSSSTVNRAYLLLESQFNLNLHHLPEALSFDEFHATKDTKGKMAFIYTDASSGRIIDILPSRKKHDLIHHFKRYPKHVRAKVKFITLDMYTPYFDVIKLLFPNASIIIDRFHIVQLITRSLNKIRIQVMNTHRYSNPKLYRKLKKYWKLLLKNKETISYSNYQYHRLFQSHVTHHQIIHHLINQDDLLKQAYYWYQDFLHYFKTNQFDQLKSHLESHLHSKLPYLHTSIQTLHRLQGYLKDTLTSPYNNGRLEAINNRIKVIKRISYGFKSFHHFRLRILAVSNLLTYKKS